MKERCENMNPLTHEGTSQFDRELWARNPENVVLHDLKPEDWLDFAYNYAEQVNYYTTGNPDNAAGNWQQFFAAKEEIKEVVTNYSGGEIDPSFGLFLSFLKLLTFSQKSLNELPKRHLDYYYKEVLQLRKKPSQPDKVHVLFELSKNAKDSLIEKGILLDAGNDSDGNPLRYKIVSPVVVNSAKVSVLRSIYQNNGSLKYAFNPKHPEGVDEAIEEGGSWNAFGNNEWQEADYSFYIASQVLYMKEGERTITLELEFDGSHNLELNSNEIEAKCSGSKGWVTCENLEISQGAEKEKITCVFKLGPEEDKVTAYDEKIHQQGLETALPVIKITLPKANDYTVLRKLLLEKIALTVAVDGVQSLELQNEHGKLDFRKPFMPFGPRPKIGSKLKVEYDEMSGKPIEGFEMNMKWLNLPFNFTDHYVHYSLDIQKKRWRIVDTPVQIYNTSYNVYEGRQIDFMLKGSVLKKNKEEFTAKKSYPKENKEKEQRRKDKKNLRTVEIVEQDPLKENYRIGVKSSLGEEEFALFSNNDPLIKFNKRTRILKDAEIEIVLKESFHHDLYNKLLISKTLKASKLGEEKISSELLPNPPYTPLVDEFRLNYSAKVELDYKQPDTSASDDAGLILFHQHPFGIEKIAQKNPALFPDYSEKYFFIGLENIDPGSNVSLLFQVKEGTESPESNNTYPLQWHVLSGNDWKSIEKSKFVRNTTNNFLRSGIVELQIPFSASLDHTILDKGFVWIKITLKNPINSIAKFINVHAQAAEAVFENHNNNQNHLKSGLSPETINQLLNRRSSIKTVEQPYSSFDGIPAESASAFYRRVSERLRHKDRAVTIWDYEHLVLEQFPEVYRVKCLNHTSRNEQGLQQLSPGDVTLVLIPKISGKSGILRLEPKCSKDLRDQVEIFFKKRISPHVNLHIENPYYEKVSFDFDVMFTNGLDFEYHKLRVEEDLKKLLTPWALDSTADIEFGHSFNVYEIVHYLENLGYVDYVENFKMYHHTSLQETAVKTNLVEPGTPLVILVSGSHTIEPVKTPCENG